MLAVTRKLWVSTIITAIRDSREHKLFYGQEQDEKSESTF